MTRLDEKGIKGTTTDPFYGLDTVIDLQKKLYGITNKHFYWIAQTKINDATFEYGGLTTMLQESPQTFDIAKAAFGTNSRFHQWVDTLTSENQKDFALNMFLKENSITKDKYELNVGRSSIEIMGGGSYISSNYMNKIKSRWLEQQEINGGGASFETANKIEEFIKNERTSVISTCAAQVVLFEYLNDPQVSNVDKACINQYLEQVALYRAAYELLDLHEILVPQDQSLEQTISRLCEKYNSRSFEKYQAITESMFPLAMQMNTLASRYPHLQEVAFYTAPVFQIAPRYSLLLKEMEKEMRKMEMNTDLIELAEVTAKSRAASYQGGVDSYQRLSQLPIGSPQRREAALTGLLQLHLLPMTYSDETYKADQITFHRSTYLENLLVEAYPEYFTKPRDLFLISETQSRHTLQIYEALGINPMHAKAPLRPSTFDPKGLNELYHITNNPVWVILKTTKPIDEHFSLLNKVAAYHELIQLIKDGRFNLNNNPAINQARFIADELLDIVKNRLTEHPEEMTAELKTQMEGINHNIESSIAAKAYKKAMQTLTGEDRAAMPQEDKTVQRKYREFLTKADAPSAGPMVDSR